MIETFKTVEEYPDYMVSNLGNVRSFKRRKPHILSLVDYRGYQRVELFKNDVGRIISVHRLVACAFIYNPENKETVNHLNGIKNDNRVKNLEWATRSENDLHAYRIGLRVAHPNCKGRFGKLHHNSKKVDQFTIDGKYLNTFNAMKEAERETGVHQQKISCVCLGKQKQANGFIWKFANG